MPLPCRSLQEDRCVGGTNSSPRFLDPPPPPPPEKFGGVSLYSRGFFLIFLNRAPPTPFIFRNFFPPIKLSRAPPPLAPNFPMDAPPSPSFITYSLFVFPLDPVCVFSPINLAKADALSPSILRFPFRSPFLRGPLPSEFADLQKRASLSHDPKRSAPPILW